MAINITPILPAWDIWDRLKLPRRFTRDLVIGLLLGITLSLSSTSLALLTQGWRRRKAILKIPPRPIELRSDEIVDGVIGLIGNTPLIRINSLSDALGVEILGKAEFLNPGGSVKDRVALRIIEDAESQGMLYPHTGSVLFEGTVGSTGISLATVGRAKGYECCIIMPDDVAVEKVQVLEKLGARVERVRPASIVDEKQFVNLARKRALDFGKVNLTDGLNGRPVGGEDVVVTTTATLAEVEHTSDPPATLPSPPGPAAPSQPPTSSASAPLQSPQSSSPTLLEVANSALPDIPEISLPSILRPALEHKPRGFFADQFENQSNFNAHFRGTGPEIVRQTSGRIDAFISGAGTGGTIAGIGKYLKSVVPDCRIILADPEGSGLYNKVKYDVMYDPKESEGKKRRHQVDTVVEGIGINRITHNFALGLDIIDDAYRVTDVEAVSMSRYLVSHDGLYLGSSSACNLVTAVKLAKTMARGTRIVTILCDSGTRHQSKFWSDTYLRDNGIEIDLGLIGRLLE